MADVSTLKINNDSYSIKDTAARSTADAAKKLADTANTTANTANTTANAAKKLAERGFEVSYASEVLSFVSLG